MNSIISNKKYSVLSQTLIANILGNSLEWYDFALYGGLAIFIAKHFFPAQNAFTSLMLTFAAFAAGFLMRPLGSIIFGHIGDTQGRRKSLLISIILIVIPTTLLGVVPDYSHIGFFAPLLVVCIRLLQGLAVGGELAGSMTYLMEIAPKNQQVYYASYAMFGVFVGMLLGPIVIFIVSNLQT